MYQLQFLYEWVGTILTDSSLHARNVQTLRLVVYISIGDLYWVSFHSVGDPLCVERVSTPCSESRATAQHDDMRTKWADLDYREPRLPLPSLTVPKLVHICVCVFPSGLCTIRQRTNLLYTVYVVSLSLSFEASWVEMMYISLLQRPTLATMMTGVWWHYYKEFVSELRGNSMKHSTVLKGFWRGTLFEGTTAYIHLHTRNLHACAWGTIWDVNLDYVSFVHSPPPPKSICFVVFCIIASYENSFVYNKC